MDTKSSFFSNKRIIVTGGASGIGRAIAWAFLRQRAHVIVLDKSGDGLESLQFYWNHMSDECEGTLETFCLDLRDIHSLKKIFDRGEFPYAIDVLVNNAGIDKPYTQNNPSDLTWNEVLGVNVEGARNITECVLPIMTTSGRGSVIFITSIHTLQAFPGGGAYDTSKCALEGYMRWIALEYAPREIRANAVAPGFIYPTGITGGLDAETVRVFSKQIPANRPGSPEDIANAVLFLASPQAAYITGQVIRVDGGLSIKSALF
ncbi:MAG: 3-oxoacyl-[acyl-carrier protein] reductase [Parcubacteria group bacterium Gr01-1014_70]|nr:MAG: 3-oxoacyl-[acyl-carrier protein] reductase [Parcubacteria group bacterium Gr01-1014_70]